MATIQTQDTGGATPGHEDAPNAFADAFAQLSKDDDKAVQSPVDLVTAAAQASNDAAAAAAAPAAEADKGVLPDPKEVAAEAEAEASTAGGEAKAEPEAKPAPKADLSNEQFLDQFREMMKVQSQPAAAPAAAAPAAAAGPAYTADEQAVVSAYQTEFADVYKAEQLIRREEYKELVNYIFSELVPHIRQVQGTADQLANATHLDQLQAAVPDYAEVVPKVLEWVDKQPAYLKGAYQAVTKSGSVQDVVDLIGRFRTETGTAAPAAAAAPAAVPAAKPAIPAAKVAQRLAPTTSKRTGVQQDGIAADDYDGAFKAAAAAAKELA